MSKLAIPKHLSIKEFMTEESEFLRDATRGFVDGVIMPIRQQVDADEREHKIIEPVLKQVLADFGSQRLVFPEKYGGLDVTSLQEICWAAEELARGDSGMAVAALCTDWPITPIVYEPYRREDLLEEFAKIFCGKAAHFACFAMTEPQGGCDIENVDVMKGRTIRTTAELDGDEWVINGEKQWASNSRISSLYLTVCTTDPDLGEEGIALIYVPAATKGLDFSDFEVKACMHAGGILLLSASLITGEWTRVMLDQVSPRSMLSWLYLIVFGSIVAFSSYIWLLKQTAPSLVSTHAYINPVVAMILGWALADEALTSRNILAAIIIIISVAIITTYPVEKKRA